MPDYPYVYEAGSPRPIGPGGTRVRLFRRRLKGEGSEQGAEQRENAGAEEGEARWLELLRQAVTELNESFEASAVPFSCALEEDSAGLFLRVSRTNAAGDDGGQGQILEVAEESVELADLPRWLTRLRTHLGLLVDEEA